MISNAMIQKWIKMLRHDSVLHVEQSEGKHYSASEIENNSLIIKSCFLIKPAKLQISMVYLLSTFCEFFQL